MWQPGRAVVAGPRRRPGAKPAMAKGLAGLGQPQGAPSDQQPPGPPCKGAPTRLPPRRGSRSPNGAGPAAAGFGKSPFRPGRQERITLVRTARHARVAVRSCWRHSILRREGPPGFAPRRATWSLIRSRTAVFAC